MTQGSLACSETKKSPKRITGEAGHCTQETPGQGETKHLAYRSVPSPFWAQSQVRVSLYICSQVEMGEQGQESQQDRKRPEQDCAALRLSPKPCSYGLNVFCFVFRVSCSPHNLQVRGLLLCTTTFLLGGARD